MAGSEDKTKAWVTLATNDGYAVGALVLAQSLRNVQTTHKLHVIYTAGVSPELRTKLQNVFDDSTEVDILDSGDTENLALIGRPDLGITFTKLHCWRLTKYSKCVFLDADTFVVKNCDELFDKPEFSAAPDIGWPDLFNTGVFVFVPSDDTYDNLLKFALSHGSFDGGDQGLLNAYFSGWRESDANHRLSFVYNVTTGAIYSYAAALKKFAPNIKIIHFLGKQKPWIVHYEGGTEGLIFVSEYHQQWRDVYNQMVDQSVLPTPTTSVSHESEQQQLSCPFRFGDQIDMFQYQCQQKIRMPSQDIDVDILTPEFLNILIAEENNNSSYLPLRETTSTDAGERKMVGSYEAWEAGRPDFTGVDSFENIQKAMEKSLQGE